MISPEMIGVIFTACCTLVGAGAGWQKMQNNQEERVKADVALDEKINQHIGDNRSAQSAVDGQLQRQWAWQAKHEREAADMRLETQKQIGALEGRMGVSEENYERILEMFKEIKQDIRDLKSN